MSLEFKGVHSPLEYRCAEGHEWTTRPSKHIYESSWCPKCLSGRPIPAADLRALLESKGFTLIGEFKGAKQKMCLQCAEGHLWFCTLTNFKRTKHGCPECSQISNEFVRTKKRKYTISVLRGLAAKRLGKCLSLRDASDGYFVATSERGRFCCADGHEWETTFGTIIRGHWCPQCATTSMAHG